MKHENGENLIVRIYSFMKEIKYIYALLIVFLFVKMENNVIKEINIFPSLQSQVKTSVKFVIILEQIGRAHV